jgi:PAS domain S-box-containing protein
LQQGDLSQLEMFGDLMGFSCEAMWVHHLEASQIFCFASQGKINKYGIPSGNSIDFLIRNVHQDDREQFAINYLKAAQDPSIELFERRYRFPDNRGCFSSICEKNRLIRNTKGEVIFMISVWQDISGNLNGPDEIKDEHESQYNFNHDLVDKNEIMLVKDELKQINDQLVANLNTLSNQELILSQSHKIANMSSWEYDLDENKIYLSDDFYYIHGLSKNTFDAGDMRSFFMLYGEKQYEFLKRELSQIIKEEKQMDITVRAVTPLGYKKWIRLVAFGNYENKKLTKISGIAQDVTTTKERELRLRASEEKFSKAFHNDPDIKIIIGVDDLMIVDVNNRTQQIIGYSRQELIGRFFSEFSFFLTGEDERIFFDEYNYHGSIDLETIWKTSTDAYIRVSITGNCFEHGEKKYYIAVIKDISYRKIAEEKLLINEANLKATINNTNILVWSVDRDLKLVMFNEPFKRHVKNTFNLDVYPSAEVPEGVGHDELKHRWTERYKRALSGETFKLTETRSDIVLDFSLNPIIDNGIVIGVSIFGEDVTERILQEKKLNEANRMVGEFKLMAMRSVMNPHFIYNALNSIQSFIAKNDRLNAISYLSKFAKLIRGIVTNSVNNKTKLTDELDLLNHYVNLERVRFEKKFDFEMIIDPALEIEAIEIPSLLIQPYVENAIVHGLYNKMSAGKLKISVSSSNERILFEIKDDGIGRKAGLKLREEKFPAHKSMGIELTEERLKLINEKYNVSVVIEDLYDHDEPAGTTVKIWVTV